MSISDVLDGTLKWHVEHSDNLVAMQQMPDSCVDAIVTDPPAGVEFMGVNWDSPWKEGFTDFGFGDHANRRPAPTQRLSMRNPMCKKCHKHIRGTDGCNCKNPEPDEDSAFTHRSRLRQRASFVAWMTSVMVDAYRVLKPGAHMLIWALPRTSHWTATAIEDAGFDIRDVLVHIFGSGFPKSLDVSKAIDKTMGVEREIVGWQTLRGNAAVSCKDKGGTYIAGATLTGVKDIPITIPTSDAAKEWDGWSTGLKPSQENWILARKPPSESNIASNVLRWGTGAMNIDATRIPVVGETISAGTSGSIRRGTFNEHEGWDRPWKRNDPELFAARLDAAIERANRLGRWPSDLLLSHAEGCRCVGTKQVRGSLIDKPCDYDGKSGYGGGLGNARPSRGIGDADGYETVEDWQCCDECPIRILNEQAGQKQSGYMKPNQERNLSKGLGGYHQGFPDVASESGTYGDEGNVSRFFPNFAYHAKASRSEREKGLNASNHHPTVKSVNLMSWLSKLITPPNGIVLDMFCGSGSTGVAAMQNDFRFIGIEKEEEYVEMARKRIVGDCPLFNTQEDAS